MLLTLLTIGYIIHIIFVSSNYKYQDTLNLIYLLNVTGSFTNYVISCHQISRKNTFDIVIRLSMALS